MSGRKIFPPVSSNKRPASQQGQCSSSSAFLFNPGNVDFLGHDDYDSAQITQSANTGSGDDDLSIFDELIDNPPVEPPAANTAEHINRVIRDAGAIIEVEDEEAGRFGVASAALNVPTSVLLNAAFAQNDEDKAGQFEAHVHDELPSPATLSATSSFMPPPSRR